MIKIIEHLPSTLIIIFFYTSFFENTEITYIILILFFGYLLDIDHLLDFFIFYIKKKKISYRLILSGSYFRSNQKVYVIFHSFEFCLTLMFYALISNNYALIFVFFSYFSHLLQDQLTNKPKIFGYFLIYRIFNNFDLNRFCQ